MRVLTFNSHQPYLHLLATALPWTLGVVEPVLPGGRIKRWQAGIRPKPRNLRVYPRLEMALGDGPWDWILAHNVQDLLDSRSLLLPVVFLVHGTLSGRMLQDSSQVDRDRYLHDLRILLEARRCQVVYISELKRRDWDIPGLVIRSTVDARQYSGFRGDVRAVLQVCNHLRARGAMLGWDVHKEVCGGHPVLLLGRNPDVTYSREARDWEDLKEQYRSHRVYLHTAVYPYEDGYNLGMLEAMATGMPVATLAHPTSPIRDGIQGVVGQSPQDLRGKVLRLLDDPAEAVRLGAAAKDAIERQFPLRAFRKSWESLADRILGGCAVSTDDSLN